MGLPPGRGQAHHGVARTPSESLFRGRLADGTARVSLSPPDRPAGESEHLLVLLLAVEVQDPRERDQLPPAGLSGPAPASHPARIKPRVAAGLWGGHRSSRGISRSSDPRRMILHSPGQQVRWLRSAHRQTEDVPRNPQQPSSSSGFVPPEMPMGRCLEEPETVVDNTSHLRSTHDTRGDDQRFGEGPAVTVWSGPGERGLMQDTTSRRRVPTCS